MSRSSRTDDARSAAPTNRLDWAQFVARCLLGIIFLLAGWSKLQNPGTFTASLMAYDILPIDLLRPMSLVLPWLELVIGAFLVAGLATRFAAWTAVGMLAVFSAAIGQALLRGLSLEGCGCFGDVSASLPVLVVVLGGNSLGPGDIFRDACYSALGVWVGLGRSLHWSLDGWLDARRPPG